MEIINALVRNTIDFRRAQLILRALHIAVKNSPRVHFNVHNNEMIREVPDFPAAPTVQKPPSQALAQAGALARIPRPKPISITRPRPPKSQRRSIPLAPNRRPRPSPSPRAATSSAGARDEEN